MNYLINCVSVMLMEFVSAIFESVNVVGKGGGGQGVIPYQLTQKNINQIKCDIILKTN